MKRLNFLLLALMVVACKPDVEHVRNELRAPAYPLITIDPFTSAWSAADNLYDAPVTHWTAIFRKADQLGELLEKINPIADQLKALGIRVKVDTDDKYTPGYKFADYELNSVLSNLLRCERHLTN